MNRYWYAIIRCLPNPTTGEFVNVGAIAGDAVSGDWAVRGLSNEQWVRRFAGAEELSVCNDFITRVGFDIDHNAAALEEGVAGSLDDQWLISMVQSHRNIVQLSDPSILIAESAEGALDMIFGRLIVEPESTPTTRVTKHRIVSALRRSYETAHVDQGLIKQRVQLFAGEYITSKLDFAIANGHAVQLSQGWSFQISGVSELATQVKSWAYALTRLKAGDMSRIVDSDDHVSDVGPDVDVEVVVVEPATMEQIRIFNEAQQIFQALQVDVRSLDEVQRIGERAKELLDENGSATTE